MRLYLIILSVIMFTACGSKKSTEQKNVFKSRAELLRDSVDRYPDSLIFLENLVQHYRDSGRYDKAIEETESKLKQDSGNARLFEMLAILHFEQEDTTSAIKAFEQAVNLEPIPQYMISLGTMYAQTRNARTLRLMDLLIREYPKFKKESHFVKGLYYSATEKFQDAIAEYNKALDISFTFMEAYREKSIALYELGLYEKSLEVITKAVTLQNNYEEGYYYQGKVLEKLNRKNDAIECYRTALLYAPDYAEARESLNRLENKK